MKNYYRGAIDHKLQLSTLAGQDVLGSDIGDTVEVDSRCSSVNCTYSMANWTPVAEAGPILFGWAHSNYTDAEIEEWVETLGTWNRNQLVENEVSRRLIRQVGILEIPDNASDAAVYNEGRTITTKLGWRLNKTFTLRFWAYNTGTASVATTDPEVRAQGHANLWLV